MLALARGASLLGLGAVLMIARSLPPSELGRWSLALAVQGYALHLGEFGLRAVVTTEAARAGGVARPRFSPAISACAWPCPGWRSASRSSPAPRGGPANFSLSA
jgi:hypothetical protein